MTEKLFAKAPRLYENEPPSSEFPRPSVKCSCDGCDRPTNTVWVVVREGGQIRSGAAYEFGQYDARVRYKLNPGIEFVRWVTRCAECLLRDLYRSGKGQWSPKGNLPQWTDPERDARCADISENIGRG